MAGEAGSRFGRPREGGFVIQEAVFYLDVDFPLISEVPLSSVHEAGCPEGVDITTSGDAADLSMI